MKEGYFPSGSIVMFRCLKSGTTISIDFSVALELEFDANILRLHPSLYLMICRLLFVLMLQRVREEGWYAGVVDVHNPGRNYLHSGVRTGFRAVLQDEYQVGDQDGCP
jgi:hypothetical protein